MPRDDLACTVAALCLTYQDTAARGDRTMPERFLSQPEEPLTQYRAYRRMHARNEKFDQEAWLEAWTELDIRGFRYEIALQPPYSAGDQDDNDFVNGWIMVTNN